MAPETPQGDSTLGWELQCALKSQGLCWFPPLDLASRLRPPIFNLREKSIHSCLFLGRKRGISRADLNVPSSLELR